MSTKSFGPWIMLGAACLAGCGGGDTIWVKGVLQKGGEVYKPPEGRKLALHFHQLADGTSDKPTGFVELADYDARDGSFTVPGREGNGIPPGKYRIALVETYLRETFDQIKKASKPHRGQKPLDKEVNLLESAFGEKTSPFVRDLKTSTNLTLDMSKPNR